MMGFPDDLGDAIAFIFVCIVVLGLLVIMFDVLDKKDQTVKKSIKVTPAYVSQCEYGESMTVRSWTCTRSAGLSVSWA